MILDTTQIPTKSMPFYNLTIKSNAVVSCAHDTKIGCGFCMFLKVCRLFNGGKNEKINETKS